MKEQARKINEEMLASAKRDKAKRCERQITRMTQETILKERSKEEKKEP